MATQTYDTYGREATADQGAPIPPGAPVAGAGNTQSPYILRVTQAAGAGTTANITMNIGYKSRVLDCWATVTTGVASSTVQLFTATAGGGTATSSALSTASAATVRNNLTTATQVFAMGATLYAYVSGGATLPAFELCVLLAPEQ